jgi:uncharacterized protein (DUF1778 family)
MVYGDRTERVTLRLTPEETAVVTELANETGLSVSDVLRQALRTAHPDRFKKPKQKR